MVDVDTMVRWDAPDIFERYSNDKLRACVDNDNLGWLKASIEGYQHMFTGVELDWETYFNCGAILMSKKHKDLCKEITTFYEENESHLLDLQHNTLKKGSDQTPVNYILNGDKWKYELLPKKWNLTHMNRKEVLHDFLFTDIAWVWHFNGFDKALRKQIMAIKTDSTSMEKKKNAETCNVYRLYKLFATDKQAANLKAKYAAGNFGYGHAKQELFDLICDKYVKQRKKFNYLMDNKEIIEQELQKGADKARLIARGVLSRVRSNIGYNI